ncbi:MAG TPA: dTMP kinase [Verrucomicrobiota bacterium]|nr:dTMP kinase [Verrucomicrobiales bacterium]HRI12807.1 dTMP kinase [Verrucomicrobiota bacterium]
MLITFEGGEACGKSTQAKLLADRLQSAGHRVHILREPGGTPLGEKLRHLLKHDADGHGMAAETELLLMNASRAELCRRVIQPALAAGEWIVCDRFFDSTVAYQGFGRGLDPHVVQAVIRAAVGNLRPSLTFWLRVPVGEAARRLAQRQTVSDRFEAEHDAFFARVERGYSTIAAAEPNRFIPVNGEGDPGEVHQRVWSIVAARLHES